MDTMRWREEVVDPATSKSAAASSPGGSPLGGGAGAGNNNIAAGVGGVGGVGGGVANNNNNNNNGGGVNGGAGAVAAAAAAAAAANAVDNSLLNNGNSTNVASAPTIKNHSVTHLGEYLYCFGGYDGRRNHMTLLMYHLNDKRWICPSPAPISGGGGVGGGGAGGSGINVNVNLMLGGDPANHQGSSSSSSNALGAGGGGAAAMHHLAAMDQPPQPMLPGALQQPQQLPQPQHHNLFGNNPLNNNDDNSNNRLGMMNHHPFHPILAPLQHHHPFGRDDGNSHAGGAVAASASIHQHPLRVPNANAIYVYGNPPPGRNGHSATLASHDDDDLREGNGRIIIIGGWLGTGPLAASDMHVLDVARGGRQLTWYQPPVRGQPPGPCNMHSADYIKSLRSVYVFRGGNGREYLNDLHALNVDTYQWRAVETKGPAPQQRANHSSAVLDETSELFIFGGWNGGERLNDIHILNTATSTWTCPRVGGVLPHPRAGMTLTALRGRLYLFGGSGTSAKCFQDLQILDRQQMAWLDVAQYDESNPHHHHHHHQMHQQQSLVPHGGGDHSSHHPVFRFGGGNGNAGAHANHSHMFFDESQQHHPVQYGGDDHHQQHHMMQIDSHQPQSSSISSRPTQDGSLLRHGSFRDWRSIDPSSSPSSPGSRMIRNAASSNFGIMSGPTSSHTINPNDEDVPPTVLVYGRGPGRRAGHTATAVHRKIYVFGGSCGSDYLNDFYVLDTDPPPQAEVTESNTLQLLERRLRHFFNDPEFADVVFVVQGGHKVYGHKMVLSMVSDCFRAMFTTGFRETSEGEIEIPDCTYLGFVSVMEYIYTSQLPAGIVESLQQDALYMTSHQQQPAGSAFARVVEMLELADRFFLDHLKQLCEALLQPLVNTDTVEYLLAVSQKTNAVQLQAVCEHFLRNR